MKAKGIQNYLSIMRLNYNLGDLIYSAKAVQLYLRCVCLMCLDVESRTSDMLY